jgi:hypothetical protein
VVWFSPELSVTYRPRSTFGALARQYFHYGRWRRVVMRQHSGTATVRYLAAPLALCGILAGLIALPFTAWGLLLPAGYAVAVLLAAAVTARGLPARAWPLLPCVYATMHLSWGAGFLTSPRRLAGAAPSAAGG